MSATALMEAQRDNHLRAAMDRLLYGLRRFMHAYPRVETDALPDHDLVWVDDFKDGPAQTILEAMKTSPELWVRAARGSLPRAPRPFGKAAGRRPSRMAGDRRGQYRGGLRAARSL